ncbi:MAG: hypothetical protein LUG45_04400 [Clostridiales bacterium]|nr:hypothetical protein [Clostridiales bacterium]
MGQIARILEQDKVLTTKALYAKQSANHPDKKKRRKMPERPYHWSEQSIVGILERMEYTGCTCNFRPREPLNKCTSAPCGKFPSLDKQSERRTNHFGLKWLRQHSWLRILLKICHRHIFNAKSCKILKSVRITLKGYARA